MSDLGSVWDATGSRLFVFKQRNDPSSRKTAGFSGGGAVGGIPSDADTSESVFKPLARRPRQ